MAQQWPCAVWLDRLRVKDVLAHATARFSTRRFISSALLSEWPARRACPRPPLRKTLGYEDKSCPQMDEMDLVRPMDFSFSNDDEQGPEGAAGASD
jgi:hypothetical protein